MPSRTCLLVAVLVAVPRLIAQQPAASGAQQVIRAFRQIATQDLWPGFEPASVPVEFFDGANTYLFNHPSPPDGFRPVAGQQNVYVYPGQHETVRANTGTEVNGVPTATADLSGNTSAANVRAALLIHEAFHVFQAKRYPKAVANEVDLFTYPVDNADLLALRRLESAALVRAVEAEARKDTSCWAATAMTLRGKRFAGLPATAAAYERGAELHEGLAQYVEFKSIDKPAALTSEDFPPGQANVRQRAYASGQTLALLLDRLDATWKSRLEGDPPVSLDELLIGRLHEAAAPAGCDFTAEETLAAKARVQRDVDDFARDLDRRKQEFLAVTGVRLEIVAGKEPLWPQAFDPWNVVILDGRQILHTRWLKLGNGSGAIEILGRSALTEAAGAHPLFNGVRELIVTGVAEPKVSQSDGKVTIEANGVKGTFTGSVERESNV
ncbi:MAG: hypothetical protein ABSB86_13925, partial [Bryobacteraceae bacterium]